MWGWYLIYVALIMMYIFFNFKLAPTELNLKISEMNLTKENTLKGNSYINFKDHIKEANYKNLEVYNKETKNTKNVNWILFSLNSIGNNNLFLFIPDKNELWKYIILNFNWKETPIEETNNDFIFFPTNSIIWSFSYSGTTASWDIINTIDNSIYCSFDQSTKTCN